MSSGASNEFKIKKRKEPRMFFGKTTLISI